MKKPFFFAKNEIMDLTTADCVLNFIECIDFVNFHKIKIYNKTRVYLS